MTTTKWVITALAIAAGYWAVYWLLFVFAVSTYGQVSAAIFTLFLAPTSLVLYLLLIVVCQYLFKKVKQKTKER